MTDTTLDRNHPAPSGFLRTLWDLIRKPRIFFSENPEAQSLTRALRYLAISSLLVGCTGLLHSGGPTPAAIIVLFLNALVMPFLSAAVGLPVAALAARGRLDLSRYFAVFAFAGGTAALLAWHPAFLWLAESVKWVLVGFGLVHGCGLKRWPTFFVMVTSIALTVVLMMLAMSLRS